MSQKYLFGIELGILIGLNLKGEYHHFQDLIENPISSAKHKSLK